MKTQMTAKRAFQKLKEDGRMFTGLEVKAVLLSNPVTDHWLLIVHYFNQTKVSSFFVTDREISPGDAMVEGDILIPHLLSKAWSPSEEYEVVGDETPFLLEDFEIPSPEEVMVLRRKEIKMPTKEEMLRGKMAIMEALKNYPSEKEFKFSEEQLPKSTWKSFQKILEENWVVWIQEENDGDILFWFGEKS